MTQILEANGRAHLSPEIYRAYEWAREVDFPQINIDLISGMMGETEEKWRDTVRRAIELEPDSVTIYQMELPYNTVISQDMLKQGVGVTDRRLGHKAPLAKLRVRSISGARLSRSPAPLPWRPPKSPAGSFTPTLFGTAAT